MAIATDRLDHEVWTLSRDDIDNLADRLYSRGISSLSTYSPSEKTDLINASRTLRRLLSAYERAAGRQLASIMLGGSR